MDDGERRIASDVIRCHAHATPDEIIGPYTGHIAESHAVPAFAAWLGELPRHLSQPQNRILFQARNRTVCLSCPAPGGGTQMAVVKAFARPSPVRSRIYRRLGSKARRSFLISQDLERFGLKCPPPLAFLERWDGGRLMESYFVTEFQDEAVDARAELIRLFRDERTYEEGRRLLERIASEVRLLHDAGIQHNDLGHQNILLSRDEGGWSTLQFIDLNRARVRKELSVRQRAADLARLWYPASLRSAFLSAYLAGQAPPSGLSAWLRIHQLTLSVRKATRSFRRRTCAASRDFQDVPRSKYPPVR